MKATHPIECSLRRRPWNTDMSRAELIAEGCGPWDDSGLLLFPVRWFDEIPDGFEVTTILGGVAPFDASASRDHRFNFLAFGVVRQ